MQTPRRITDPERDENALDLETTLCTSLIAQTWLGSWSGLYREAGCGGTDRRTCCVGLRLSSGKNGVRVNTGRCDRVSRLNCLAETQRPHVRALLLSEEHPACAAGRPACGRQGPGEGCGSQRGLQTPEAEGPSGAQGTTSAAVTQRSHPALPPALGVSGEHETPPDCDACSVLLHNSSPRSVTAPRARR